MSGEPSPKKSLSARAWSWLVRSFLGDELADQRQAPPPDSATR